MNSREFEEFIKRNPGEAIQLISKAFKPRELLAVGNRSYIDAYKYPESRFDPQDLCSNGHNCPPNPDMLQPLSDPGKLFTDKYVIPPSSLIFQWAGKNYEKKWWGGLSGGLIDPTSLMQSAINDLDSGELFFKEAAYSPTATITMEGSGYPIATIKSLKIIGSGFGTLFNQPVKLPLFKFNNALSVVFENFKAHRAGGVNAHQIFLGDDDGASTMRSCSHGTEFNRIMIDGGGALSTEPTVLIKNPVHISGFKSCWISSYGSATVRFQQTQTDLQWGDSVAFRGENFLTQLKAGADAANPTYVLDFLGRDDRQIANMRTEGLLHIRKWPDDLAFVTGIRCYNAQHVHLRGVHSELMRTLLKVSTTCQNVSFGDSGFLVVEDGGTFFDIGADCESTEIFGLRKLFIGLGHTVTVLNDLNVSDIYPTIINDWEWYNNGTALLTGAGWTGYHTLFRGHHGKAVPVVLVGQPYSRMQWDDLSVCGSQSTLVLTEQRLYLRPIGIKSARTLAKIGWINEDPAQGSVKVGVYPDSGLDKPDGEALIVGSGAEAVAGVNRKQESDITDVILRPALHWLALLSLAGAQADVLMNNFAYQTGGTLIRRGADIASDNLPAICPVTSEVSVPTMYALYSKINNL